MRERLQKLISASGLMSRRAAEEAVSAGRVSVNGAAARLGDRADPETDQILLDGRPLPSAEQKLYIMLNKPSGYVTTLSDEKGRRNVIDLLGGLGVRVYPVGRLDMDSEGLLILTNDGDFANLLTHPSHEIAKCYEVWVEGEEPEEKAALLRGPMELDGHRLSPAEAEVAGRFPGGALLRVTIREGRNRQVRRMCALAGLKVTRLRRISEGPLRLGDLRSGCWRYLTERELRELRG